MSVASAGASGWLPLARPALPSAFGSIVCGFLPTADELGAGTGRVSPTLTSMPPFSYSNTFVTVSTPSLTTDTTTPSFSVVPGFK